jgi:hypothetical protein
MRRAPNPVVLTWKILSSLEIMTSSRSVPTLLLKEALWVANKNKHPQLRRLTSRSRIITIIVSTITTITTITAGYLRR